MNQTHILKLLLLTLIPLLLIIIIIITIILLYLYIKKHPSIKTSSSNLEHQEKESSKNEAVTNAEENLLHFHGGENLTVSDILDAPGEVIGKNRYGTIYLAKLVRDDSIYMLRFLRPVCSVTVKEVVTVVTIVGSVRHSNLVPLLAFYCGPRGEKLLVYPFYAHGNLAHFINDGSNGCRDWNVIYNICHGLAKGLAYLHTGFHIPIIHGNLKAQNVLLDRDLQPCISNYGLHLLLNDTAGLEMLASSAAQGYKAPELMKIKDANQSTDIYSLGIILLELITGREPIKSDSSDSQDVYLPNFIRKAILDHRIIELYHPDIVSDKTEKQKHEIEDRVLRLVQLAMACCSPSPYLRPLVSEVVRKVEEIAK